MPAGLRPFVTIRTSDPTLTEMQQNTKDTFAQLDEIRRGLVAFSPKVVSGDYTIGEERYVIYTGTGNHTLYLPKANALGGKARDVVILNLGDGSTGGLNIKASGSDTFNGGLNGLLEAGGAFIGIGDGATTWKGVAGSTQTLEIRAPAGTVDRDLFQIYLGTTRVLDFGTRLASIGNRPHFDFGAEIFAKGDISAGAAPSPSSAIHVSLGRYILLGNPVTILGDFLKGGLSIGSAATDKLGAYGVPCVVQPAAIASPAGGATVDVQARAAIDAIRAALTATGWTA